jgi:hypothetical protein
MSGLIRPPDQRDDPQSAEPRPFNLSRHLLDKYGIDGLVKMASVDSPHGFTVDEIARLYRVPPHLVRQPPMGRIFGYPVYEVGGAEDPTIPVGHPDYRPAPIQIPDWDPFVDQSQQTTMNRQHFDWEYWGPYLRAGAPYGDTEEGCRRWGAEREALRYQPDALPEEDNPGLRFVPFDDPSAVVGTTDPRPPLKVADLKVTIRADASGLKRALAGLSVSMANAQQAFARLAQISTQYSVTIDELHNFTASDVQLLADMGRGLPLPMMWAATNANDPVDKPTSAADVLAQKRAEQRQRQQDQARPGHRFRPHRQRLDRLA